MALRVLLADESTSIKKVMQLALQDFGVEVKAVPVGVDVIPVSKSWTPDIVFIDVLLSKKSGYEVCQEFKADRQLGKTPVVLMWSGFMEIDEARAQASGAERRLEKPFDADSLRSIVKDLVPSVSGNLIANYISFPNLPDFVEKQPTPPPGFGGSSTVEQRESAADREVDEPEDFMQVPLPKVRPAQAPGKINNEANWTSGNLERFKIQIPKDEYSSMEEGMGDLDDSPIALSGAGEVPLGELDEPRSRNSRVGGDSRPISSTFGPSASNVFGPSALSPNGSTAPLDPAFVEQLLRDQVRAVLQDIAWKIIPDITERIVREEIQKLLKDAEKLS